MSPALAPLAWWLGDWSSADGEGSEHWVAVAGALYGIGFSPGGGFEVMIVDDGEGPGRADGILRLIAMPGGERAVEFRVRDRKEGSATFANEAHDDPKEITYLRKAEELRAVIAGDRGSIEVAFKRGSPQRAPELEAADIAFDADTAARGIEGWVAAFDPEGAMMRRGAPVVGRDAIREMMKPLLSSGRLRWAPTASGRSGDVGFTVGKGTFTGDKPGDTWQTSYVTIWRRGADGSWKVRFDTGRPVHESPSR